MANFIEVLTEDKACEQRLVLVNPEFVVSVKEISRGRTVIDLAGREYSVWSTENYQTIRARLAAAINQKDQTHGHS